LFDEALEEGRIRQQRLGRKASSSSSGEGGGTLPLWGPDDGTFHWNPVLLQNTKGSPYFQRCCENLRDWSAVVDEIYEQDLDHLRPYSDAADRGGRTPSTAFCLLLRLLLVRLTRAELHDTLSHPDSPYIRGIGFLYVRYAVPPESVLEWISPYLLDDEEVRVGSGRGGGKPSDNIQTLGGYVRMLFGGGVTGGGGGGDGSREYFGTPLPRYPLAVERDIRVQVLHHDKIDRRAIRHATDPSNVLEREFRVGNSVLALYGDEDNPIDWYVAVIDRVMRQDPDTGRELRHPKYVVTFTEYGNTETVTLGELDVLGANRDSNHRTGKRDASGCGRGGYRDDGGGAADAFRNRNRRGRSGDDDDTPDRLYEEVIRREQESAATSDRSGYARKRPRTAAAGLSTKSRHAVLDDNDDDPGHYTRDRGSTSTGRNAEERRRREGSSDAAANARAGAAHTDHRGPESLEPTRKRTADELAAAEEKKRRLLAKYG
jgi:pre-mRNA-splicing factor 38B